jgi:hypothetical protein
MVKTRSERNSSVALSIFLRHDLNYFPGIGAGSVGVREIRGTNLALASESVEARLQLQLAKKIQVELHWVDTNKAWVKTIVKTSAASVL